MNDSDTQKAPPLNVPKAANRRELSFGIAAAVAAAGFALFVIPSGVETPDSVEHLPLSPAFLPYAVAGLIFVFALLHILEALTVPPHAAGTQKDDTHPSWLPRAIIMSLCLIGYYYLPEIVGLLGVSILATGGLMYLGGERSKLILIGGSLVLPTLVFLFFTRVAQVPIPLGFFE